MPPSQILSKEIRLLIGLGNPGVRYQNTYHNVGQHFIDELAGFSTAERTKRRRKAVFRKGEYFEYLKIKDLVLIKTTTFMNQSGKAVASAIKYFKVKPQEILVIHDDSDIELGNYKISRGRGAGGHQGVLSVIKSLRTKRFTRIRIGVRASSGEERRRLKAGDFVLQKIKRADLYRLKSVFQKVKKDIWLEDSKSGKKA